MAKRISRPKAPATEAATLGPASGPLRAVYGSYSPVEAHIVKGMLEDSGIGCFLSNELIAAVDYPVSFGTGGVQVLVQASDADRAGQLLREQSSPC